MPQMSPLMWSELFLTFSALFLISSVKIYFLTEPSTPRLQVTPRTEQAGKNHWTW